MAFNNNIKLHILGAGPAGLAAGYFAKKEGIPFHIFEASGVYGGNCRTIVEGDYRFDTGAHRFHDKNQEITNEIKSLMRIDQAVEVKKLKIELSTSGSITSL